MFRALFAAVAVLSALRPTKCDRADTFCFRGRAVPSLFILGVQKSGTTTLHDLIADRFPNVVTADLDQHATIFSAHNPDPRYYRKELHFLDEKERYVEGLPWYSSYFPNCTSKKVAIDSTPNYFSNEGQAQGDEFWHRLHKAYNTHLKPGWEQKIVFVVVFRDPATRFLSAFKHLYVRDKGATGQQSFPILARAVRESTKSCAVNYTLAACQGEFGHDMLRKGFYAELLKYWIETFPTSNFLLSTMDELKRSPEELLRKISHTIGTPLDLPVIQQTNGAANVEHNKGVQLHLSSAGKQIERKALEELQQFYDPLNVKFWSQLVLLLRQHKHVSFFGRLFTLGS
eukprot:m.202059 g.202059  ORF g.202059 m.202059 type:complete len:343 (+) comp18812_c0_seq1:136-1164(+)